MFSVLGRRFTGSNICRICAFIEVEQANQELIRQKQALQDTIDNVKDSADRQIKELELKMNN